MSGDAGRSSRAVVFDRFGGPEVLRVAAVPVDPPGEGEVLVRVKAAGINPLDAKYRRGELVGASWIRPVVFPQRLGNELAGTVEAVGPGVDGLAVGTAVSGFVSAAAYADHVVVRADSVAPVPARLGWEPAAALPIAGLTAHHAVDGLGLGPDDLVVIHAAAGGIGTVAVQLAAARGARVIGTASVANHDYLRELGAIPVAYGPGVADRLREAAGGSPITAAIDGAGDEAVEASLQVVADRSRIATVVSADHARRWQIRYIGGSRDLGVLARLGRDVVAGRLRLPTITSYPIDEVVRAHVALDGRHLQGKLVLTSDEAYQGPDPVAAPSPAAAPA